MGRGHADSHDQRLRDRRCRGGGPPYGSGRLSHEAVEPDVLSARVDALLARRPSVPAAGAESPGGLLGRSPSMRAVFEIIARVGPTDATVLVTARPAPARSSWPERFTSCRTGEMDRSWR